MRRMKEMSAHQQGMSFYGNMPDQYTLVVNTAHPLTASLANELFDSVSEQLKPLQEQLAEKQTEEERIKAEQKDIKSEDLTQEQKDAASAITKEVADLKAEIKKVYAEAAKQNPRLHQLIDIALLASGMLKGEGLAQFVKRSVDLING